MHGDEKYNVRVSTRHYKGPELLTNDTVVERGGFEDRSTITLSTSGRCLACFSELCSTALRFSAEKITTTSFARLRRLWEAKRIDRYIAKYKLRLDKETVRLLGRYERRPWTDFVNEATRKFINDDLFDYLDKTLVYDHNVWKR